MPSRRSSLLVALVLLVVGGAIFLRDWFPFDPFEGTAGPLAQLVPDDVDAVVRFDPSGVRTSAAAATLWEHDVVQELVASSGLRERVLEPLAALEVRLGRATLGLAPRMERDVFGEEVVVAVRDDDVLLLSRVSGRGRALDLARKLDASELGAAGLVLDGDVAVLSRSDAPTVYIRRHRDVLAVSTSRGLVEGVAVLGELADEQGPRPTPFGSALDSGRSPGGRVLLWARPAAWAPRERRGERDDGGAATNDLVHLWRGLLPPGALGPVAGWIDTSDATRVTFHAEGEYPGDIPPAVAAVQAATSDEAGVLRLFAESLAVPGETIVATGLAVRAEDCIRTLVTSQPESRRALIQDLLADQGLTVDALAEGLAEHLRDGVAAVVARLGEAAELPLDDARGGAVLPIPATLVALRLRTPEAAADVEERLRADARTLLGAELGVEPEALPGGGRLIRPTEHNFGGEWALLRPAVAITDGWLVFCTHEGFLRRALARRRASDEQIDVDASRTLSAHLRVAALREYIDDQRWAWADRMTYHDWKAERQAIREQLDRDGSALLPEDRRIYEDARIERRFEARNRDEFPAAIERYREIWRPLEALGDVRIGASIDGRRFALRIDVELGR